MPFPTIPLLVLGCVWSVEPAMVPIPGSTLLVGGSPRSTAPLALATTELTWGEWAPVRAWALAHGYAFGPGRAESPSHPVSAVTWHDAVKFCNAASELAGRTPVYVIAAGSTEPYRTGIIASPQARPGADGYRLPGEWEWESAARAGSTTKYPWGDAPDERLAWFTDNRHRGEDVSPHPVGLKPANAYGLFDVAGNVAEWTFDRYRDDLPWRVQRGGSVALDNDISCGFRSPVPADFRIYDAGLRLASSDPACPPLARVIASRNLPPAGMVEVLAPPHAYDDVSVVAKRLAGLLDPRSPEAAPILALVGQGRHQEALERYRDGFLARLRRSPAKRHLPAKPPTDPAAIAAWLAAAERDAGLAKTAFDNGDNRSRALPNSYAMPRTWDFGMGFSPSFIPWYDVLRQIAIARPDQPGAHADLSARAVANLAIYATTDDIAKTIKDPRNVVGNQQLDMAAALVLLAHLHPEFRDARAWETLADERIRTGSLARYFLADGGDLEQSLNYNRGLLHVAGMLEELYPGPPRPDWVDGFIAASVRRTRLFAALRHPSGTLPNIGNNAYKRDLPADPTAPWSDHDRKDPLTALLLGTQVQGASAGRPLPAFTSIAFPFTGYYVQRNGWGRGACQLFFKSSRPGAGHNHADNNGLDLCAWGRHLLVTRESPPYQVLHLPDGERKDLPWILAYKGEEAPFTANTVLVDGCGQMPGWSGTGYSTTIPQQWWYSGTELDAVQGTWTRTFARPEYPDPAAVRIHATTYGATPDEVEAQVAAAQRLAGHGAERFAATHTRQVLYLRRANAWIVTDWVEREDGKPVGSLSQQWHLPGAHYPEGHPLWPGFTKDQVRMDETAGRLETANPDNVNLAILNAANGGMRYELHAGEKYPHRGWANTKPSMVSGYSPAVDLLGTSQGSGPAIAVLVPIPQGATAAQRIRAFTTTSGSGRTGFQLTLDEGTRVDYVAGQDVDGAGSVAQVILQRDGQRLGMTLSRPGPCPVYTLDGNARTEIGRATVPTGFSWQTGPQGTVPAYVPEQP